MTKTALASTAFLILVACGSTAAEPHTTQSEPLGAIAPAVVACGNGGAPQATCAAPEHCCFTNYTAAHDGYCSTGACFYGTVTCDGPEDCAAGEVCCASALTDPDYGTYGYVVACRSTACGTAPLERELCHVGGAPCASPGAACVSAAGRDNDLPADLSICQ